MKKNILSSIIGASLACTTVAAFAKESMVMRVPIKQSLSNWSGADPIYHPWTDVGGHYACDAWSPEPNTVNYGKNYTQSRDCSQDQQRDVEIREKDSFSGEVKTVRTDKENRTISERESQAAVGTYRDWRSTESTYTEWSDTGADYNFSSWSPVASSQTANFNQSRSYERDQERFEQKREQDAVTGDIRNVGEPVKHEQADRRSQTRSVLVAATPWSDVGGHYGCSEWSPEPDTVDVYQRYTQTRDCKQNQSKRWSYDADGSEIHSRMQNQTITEVESREAEGTRRDWIAHDSVYTNWTDYGSTHSYSAWTPAANAQTTNFTQTRDYKQPQERDEQKREIDTVSGETRNTGSPIRHTRDDNRSESRAVTVSWNNWSVSRNDYNCGTWSPATNTKGYGESYTQTRSCKEDQTRNRYYKVGSSTIKTVPESRTISVTQSQSATGTGSWSAYSASCGSWSSTGNHSFSSYSPAYGSQTSNYTQTRSYKQNQSRTCQPRERDSISGTIRNTGSAYTETRTVNKSQSRTITVSGSGWSNTTRSNYSSYSPTAGTQTSNFTQTRTYTQNQKYTYTHKSGTTVVYTRDITRGLTGQKQSRTVTATWSGWSFHRNHSFSGYSPSTTTVCSGQSFTQTETYKRKEKRTISYSIGGTGPTGYRDLNRSRSRSATGTKSCGGTWSSGSFVYSTPTYYSNCPGAVYSDLQNKGYTTSTTQKSGSCTSVGAKSDYMSLQYGGSCKGTIYRQTCK